jgi:heme o synthase
MSMKTALPIRLVEPSVAVREATSSRVAAFVALTKPRIAVMVLLTVAVGYVLGARGSSHPATMAFTLLGAGLVAAGASAWNQVIERERDGRMRRTARRPLPAGLIQPFEAAVFATILALVGIATLFAATTPMAAFVAMATFLLYVAAYTPLKPITTLNTAVGAIPGALPPVIGWAAATGMVGMEAFALFLIVFLWQFPHFLAIAWVHRDDYARGGHKMLPCVDPDGRQTARQAVAYALVLVPAGLLPTIVGVAGGLYFAGALVAGLAYLAASIRFYAHRDDTSARKLMMASFVYLPLILLLLLVNPMPA